MTDRELVARIARSPGSKAGYKQLVRELSLGGGRERRLLLEQLNRLTARGELTKLDREHWSIPAPPAPVDRATTSPPDASTCTVTATASSVPRSNNPPVSLTIFLFPPTRSTAPCRAIRSSSKSSRPAPMAASQGRIARILERRNATVVGTFRYSRGERFPHGPNVDPFRRAYDAAHRHSRPAANFRPPPKKILTAHRVLGREAASAPEHDSLEGLVVDVEITSWPTPTRPPGRPRRRSARRPRRLRRRRRNDDSQAPVPARLSRTTSSPKPAPSLISTRTKRNSRRDFRDLPSSPSTAKPPRLRRRRPRHRSPRRRLRTAGPHRRRR
jgi:ribonuclease R